MECSICGISDKMRTVSDALSPKGIIQVCDRCASEEGLISLKKPRVIGLEEEKHETMYERMSRIAGVKIKNVREKTVTLADLQNKSLREIVDKNYEKKMKQEIIVMKPRPDLVDNFHWIIMRVRRVKGLTQGQLAERISEPEAAIKMAEQGVVPEGYGLIDKLERFLGVRLIKQRDLALPIQRQQQHLSQQLQQSSSQQAMPARTLNFDKNVFDSLTIADLKRMKQEREEREANEKLVEEPEEHEQAKPSDRLDYE